jgi:hypothetical protein
MQKTYSNYGERHDSGLALRGYSHEVEARLLQKKLEMIGWTFALRPSRPVDERSAARGGSTRH